MARLFVAVVPPPDIQREALRQARSLSWSGAVRWLPPENVHLTLKFLGEVPETPDSKLPELHETITALCSGHGAFDLSLRGAGAFPSVRRACVLWVGASEGSGPLGALARDLEDGLEKLGFGRETRPFRPHATVARAKGGGARLEDPAAADTVGPLDFRAGSIELMRSRLSQEGAAYSNVASYPLRS
ncbi:RNA 2',3'-cyclic phosphodiesterase [Rubrobacter aplysinae]|uniref:RNA 2',3'-cyclic phosphodiesterase n=1 Tax=Rubrobacter aplysinae TaxID=909625 RepID=UPI00069CC2F7|nr:RNA 2',3'-cyclic phosphodiesterase [Rubrobacter aplysinae]